MVVIVLGVLLRTVLFSRVPAGLNQDEAATGYDAFALLRYGIDRNGFHNPLMFVSWGSGMYALPGYLAMLFYVSFGISVASLRCVNLVAGVASLVSFFAITRRTVDRQFALLATFLLAISPWHVMSSRWALDSNLFPALFLFAAYFLQEGSEDERNYYWAAVFFGLTVYAYGTAYIVTPLFLLLWTPYLLFHKRIRARTAIGCAIVVGLLMAPIAAYLLINQYKWPSFETPVFSIPRLTGVPRYQTVSSLFGGSVWREMTGNLGTLWQLLASGDDGLIWNAISGYGYLYAFALPLAVVGFVATTWRSRWREYQPALLFCTWMFCAIGLAAMESVNINRINIIFFPIIFFVAAGIQTLSVRRSILVAFVGFYCVSLISFSRFYFGYAYRAEAEGPFFASLGTAIDAVAEGTSGTVCITDHINQPYIFVLFYRRIDPRVFLRTVHYENPGAEFQGVSSFDRYVFGLRACDPAVVGGYLADKSEENLIDQEKFTVTQIGRYLVAIRKS